MAQSSDDTSLTERAYEQLSRMLRYGALEPSTTYSVVELARELGVSRTPTREALLRLASEGIVSLEHNRGIRVLATYPKDISDLFGLRLLLEAPSAAAAAVSSDHENLQRVRQAFAAMSQAADDDDEVRFERHDATFHDAFLFAAGNNQVADAVSRARGQMSARPVSTTQTRSLADVLAAHIPIYDAIEAKDPAAAESAVKHHLERTRDILIAQLLETGI